MRFSTAKLMDYEADWPALENETNPFAVVVMAHAGTRATVADPHARLDWKFRLPAACPSVATTASRIIGLYRFIDWVMALPDNLELEYDRQVDEYQEDRKMEYLSSMERRAMERGRQAGILEGAAGHTARHAARHAARRAIRTGCHSATPVGAAFRHVVQRGRAARAVALHHDARPAGRQPAGLQ